MPRLRSIFILFSLLIVSLPWWSPPVFAGATIAPVAQATFALVSATPGRSAMAVLTTTIRATFNANIDMTTVTAQSLLVQSNMRGLLTGAFSYDGGTFTLTFTPDRALLQGEVVTVIATDAIKSDTGAILVAEQWHFTASAEIERCIAGFKPYTDAFTRVWSSAAAWGDYDNDGDLDALVAGQTSGSRVAFIYRNDGNSVFSKIVISVPGVREGSVDWGDYDNDGDLDILLAGESSGGKITHIYRNDGNNSFVNSNVNLPGIWLGDATWVDYNNDGYLDVFIAGQSNTISLARLYRNDRQGGFTEISAPFVGVNNGSADWGDYDNDGDLDLLLTGDAAGVAVAVLYRNDRNDTFVDAQVTLVGVRDSAIAWGDFDGDQDEDLLLTGNTNAFTATTIVYRNDGNGLFTAIGAGMIGVSDGAVAWGDYDNDGDPDVLISGKDAADESTTYLYANANGAFSRLPFTLPAVSLGSVVWGDYDQDLDLDILLTGLADDQIVTGVYQNYDCPSDVAITKQVTPTLLLSSQPVTFTVAFTNLGPVTATTVIITDIIPSELANVQVVSTTNNVGVTIVDSGALPRFVWHVSNLRINEGGVITITGDLTPQPGAVYTNTVQIMAAKDITLTNNTARAAVMAPFRVIGTTPVGNGTLSATPTADLAMTFDADLNLPTLNFDTLQIVGSQTGSLGPVNTSYDSNGRTYTFHTNRAVKVGETVSIVGTGDIKSTAGAPLVPYQWQFVAGRTSPRCVGDFTDMTAGLPAVALGAVAWGDYDGDGDLDLFLMSQSTNELMSRIYRNDAGAWTLLNAGLTPLADGAAAWGDYDGDGDLDLLLTGHDGANALTNLYANGGNGVFTAVNPALPGVANSAVAWGDYDNDGDLDLLIAGSSNGGRLTRVYRNDALTFVDSAITLPGITDGTVAWQDYDNDGDLDIFLTGSGDGGPLAALYQNNSGVFTDLNAGFTPVFNSAAAWGDYDNDHDLDLLLTGHTGLVRAIQLYNNTNGVFTATNPVLPAIDNGAIAWGDYDNDGTLDLLLAGADNGGRVAGIYRQQGGVFTDFGAALVGITGSAAAWGDYDGDGDVDFVLSGVSDNGPLLTVRRNTNCISDTRIVKTVQPTTAVANDVITYTLTFSNAGPQPALGVVITDLLPADIVPGAIQSTGAQITDTNAATGKVWQVSNLAVGQGGMITVTATVLPGASGAVFTNTAVITALHDITLTNNLAAARVGRPFYVISTTPGLTNVVGIPLEASIQATFDADVNATTAALQNLAVYGELSGLRTGLVSYEAGVRTLFFTPTIPLQQGEGVNVIGLAGLQSVAGAPLAPYQWQFTAGRYVDDRCIAEFRPIPTALPGLLRSDMAWGDYDQDNDLDVALIGSPDGAGRLSKIYRNDGNGLFTDSGAALTAVSDGAVRWGDYDKDGDLDLLLTGASANGPTTHLYRNDNALFSEASVGLPGFANSSVAWGDYDNDGNLDIALAGTADGSNGVTLIYHNNGAGGFTNSNAALTGIYRGAVAWADAEGDGDLDLLLTGTTNGSTAITQLYGNDEGNFVNLNLTLPALYDSDVAWGDYDNDGARDFVLMGTSDGANRVTTLLHNDGGNLFTSVATSLPALSHGSVTWGDYENDGDLDLLLTGTSDGNTPLSQIWINNGAQGFSDAGRTLANVLQGVATWQDYDNDADLDVLVIGNGANGALAQLYRSIDCVSDLALYKTVEPPSVLPGELVTYTLTFNNLGPQTATRVILTDLLPLDKLNSFEVNSTLTLTQIGPPYIWRLPDLAPGTGGTITILARTGYLATGAALTNVATISAREDITDTNDVASAPLTVRAPQANFAAATTTFDEQTGNATLTVILNEPNLAGAVTLAYESTTSGSAQAGSDYTPISGFLTIPTGQTTATIDVPVADDALDEDDETIIVTLSNPIGVVLGATATTTLTILDNDVVPILNIGNATVDENSGSVLFPLTLNVPSGRLVSVTASTADGTATAPSDYRALTDVLITIPPGETATSITVQVVDDGNQEQNEQFFINLTSPINVSLLAGQATATIADNDNFGVYMPLVWR